MRNAVLNTLSLAQGLDLKAFSKALEGVQSLGIEGTCLSALDWEALVGVDGPPVHERLATGSLTGTSLLNHGLRQ